MQKLHGSSTRSTHHLFMSIVIITNNKNNDKRFICRNLIFCMLFNFIRYYVYLEKYKPQTYQLFIDKKNLAMMTYYLILYVDLSLKEKGKCNSKSFSAFFLVNKERFCDWMATRKKEIFIASSFPWEVVILEWM